MCLGTLLLPFALRSAEDKRLAIYSNDGHFFLPVVDIEQREYVVLEDLLVKLGQVATSVRKETVRMRFRRAEGEFTEGARRFRVGNAMITSTEPIRIQEGKVLAPTSVLPLVLKNYGLGEAELHAAGRRLFLSGTKQQVEHSLRPGESSTLTLDFPAPVNPNVSSDGNRIHLVFRNEPIVWGADRVDYTDKLIRALAFGESNGQSEVTVQGAAPLLASFSNGGKTITISAAPAPVAVQAPPTTSPSSPLPATATETEPAPAAVIPENAASALPPSASPGGPAHFFVLIDAAHGGDDPGVKFSDKLAEKEISLIVAQRLRVELQDRGITALMVRSDDTAVSLEARAVMANEKHAGLYVSLHAGGPGNGVRVYTALMGTTPQNPGASLFMPWGQAQRPYLDESAALAHAMVKEIANRKIEAAMMPGPIAPLPSIAAPAVALEIAPPPSKQDPEGLKLAAYQKTVVEAATKAIVATRGKLAQGGGK